MFKLAIRIVQPMGRYFVVAVVVGGVGVGVGVVVVGGGGVGVVVVVVGGGGGREGTVFFFS